MRRRAAKVDANQVEIVNAFRQCGATVVPTHAAGKGFPDLVVGYRGHNLLIEVKDGNKPPSAQRLTQDQIEFHATWRGSVFVVESHERVPELLNLLKFCYTRPSRNPDPSQQEHQT